MLLGRRRGAQNFSQPRMGVAEGVAQMVVGFDHATAFISAVQTELAQKVHATPEDLESGRGHSHEQFVNAAFHGVVRFPDGRKAQTPIGRDLEPSPMRSSKCCALSSIRIKAIDAFNGSWTLLSNNHVAPD